VRPGRAADHSPPSSVAVMEECSYTSTHPLGHIGALTGTLYLSGKCHTVFYTHNSLKEPLYTVPSSWNLVISILVSSFMCAQI